MEQQTAMFAPYDNIRLVLYGSMAYYEHYNLLNAGEFTYLIVHPRVPMQVMKTNKHGEKFWVTEKQMPEDLRLAIESVLAVMKHPEGIQETLEAVNAH